jgi:hypothetical protein
VAHYGSHYILSQVTIDQLHQFLQQQYKKHPIPPPPPPSAPLLQRPLQMEEAARQAAGPPYDALTLALVTKAETERLRREAETARQAQAERPPLSPPVLLPPPPPPQKPPAASQAAQPPLRKGTPASNLSLRQACTNEIRSASYISISDSDPEDEASGVKDDMSQKKAPQNRVDLRRSMPGTGADGVGGQHSSAPSMASPTAPSTRKK